jgi:hypothetical protein
MYHPLNYVMYLSLNNVLVNMKKSDEIFCHKKLIFSTSVGKLYENSFDELDACMDKWFVNAKF